MKCHIILVIAVMATTVSSLDNGLALTPPMGWINWERFRCTIDCKEYPNDCVSENLFKSIGDAMVSEGYLAVGYNRVNIDDCWAEKQRDSNGKLVADKQRFPNGIRKLADYMHAKGLKLGIYGDFGHKTCAGYPGVYYHMQTDAQTYADWQVDMLKLDGCYAHIEDMDEGYPAMGWWLNKTGRPILYSCSWPAYQFRSSTPNYPAIAKACNMWRNFNDIDDSWDSVLSIINFYGEDKGNFSQVAGPGNWNDPDMLIIGNYGLSYEQQRVQMAMWAIMAAPLMMSHDLRNTSAESKAILQNKNVIAINQDPLGKAGRRIKNDVSGKIQIWTKQLHPAASPTTWAFAIMNTGGGVPKHVTLKLSELGLFSQQGYMVTEVFNNGKIGTYKPSEEIKVIVNPEGVFLGKAVPIK